MAHSRRDFLAGLGCAFLSKAAFAIGADQLFVANALAGPYAPAGVPDYKALVCIFLFGGNDANNMVIPITDYGDYSAPGARDPSTAINISVAAMQQAGTLITPPSDGRDYGLHPAFANEDPRWPGLHALWQQQNVAIVTNIGTLIRPITRDEFRNDPRVRPYQLFSHSNQQDEWQTAVANSQYPTGWGGRTSDITVVDPSGFPTISSVAGVTIFSAGRTTRPLVLPPAPTQLRQALRLNRPGDRDDGSALRTLIAQNLADGTPPLLRGSARLTDQAIQNSLLLEQDDPTVREFPATSLGNQLKQIAKLIALGQQLGLRRQIFFASIGGFDTHDNQGGPTGNQANLFRQVSQAMSAFYLATDDLGVASQVTSFTMSDFSRTLNPGSGGRGTDHAWGSHQFVMGGAVLGGDFYGTFPSLVRDGENDSDRGPNARGRWVPTTSVDQYGATLATWFGVSASDLPAVFPNIGEFPTSDLGFMATGAGATKRARRQARQRR